MGNAIESTEKFIKWGMDVKHLSYLYYSNGDPGWFELSNNNSIACLSDWFFKVETCPVAKLQ